MPVQTEPFKEIRFTGGRFDGANGWLDVEALIELQFYRKLIIAIAGEKWRHERPGRERLPRGFKNDFSLGISEVGSGSAVAVMQRFIPGEEQLQMEDDFASAAQIIDDTLLAVRDNEQFPAGLTTAVLPMFGRWGKTLRSEESMVLGRDENAPEFNAAIRERLLSRILTNEPYIDEFDVDGEIRAAELSNQTGGLFRIRMDNGHSIPGVFTDEQESSITEALRDHSEVRLRLSGQGSFEPSGTLQRILSVDYHEVITADAISYDDAPSILDIFDEIHRSIPEEAFDALPSDGATNLKHYLYGWPKEEE